MNVESERSRTFQSTRQPINAFGERLALSASVRLADGTNELLNDDEQVKDTSTFGRLMTKPSQ